MGASKRPQRNSRAPAQLRSRHTRSKGKILSDPAQNTQLLTEQLRSLGLYAAPTLGDGNCLFRALSDQLHGTPSYHLQLRKDICDWIESHKPRYEPFCEDERGLDAHLRCMREHGTYGGHLELSAFAHLYRRNVKVVQPGLVYVIEWTPTDSPDTVDNDLDDRERRRLRRDKKRAERPPEPETEPSAGPVYVAYHDWEHFSSIRNLKGPHTGLPDISESTPEPESAPSTRKPPSKRTATKPVSKSSSKPSPAQIPLPASRSPSLTPSIELDVIPPSPITPPAPTSVVRMQRSPKRSFDESSGSSESSFGMAKRTRSHLAATMRRVEIDDEDLESTPGLSAPGSSSESSSSSSSAPSPLPTPVREKPMTRRQRKAASLPKTRTTRSAGKIVIPGGRYSKKTAADEDEDDEHGEWQRNGTGRVDVRGFRELKI